MHGYLDVKSLLKRVLEYMRNAEGSFQAIYYIIFVYYK